MLKHLLIGLVADENAKVGNACKEHEADLEVFYRLFAQPNKLMMSQVAVVGTTMNNNATKVPLKKKLKSLDYYDADLVTLVRKENRGRALALIKPKLDSIVEAALS